MNKISMVQCVSIILLLTGCADDATRSNSDTLTASDSNADDGETGDHEVITSSPSSAFGADLGEESPVSLCDPFLQDCAEGYKCVPYSSTGGGGYFDANKCVPVYGDGVQGDPCLYEGIVTAIDSCDENHLCWNVEEVNGDLMGTCTPFCRGTINDPKCEPDTSCFLDFGGSLNVCLEDCDPLLQDCEQGDGCYFWDSGNDPGFNCLYTSVDIPVGEPCGYVNDCAPGNMCVDASHVPNCNGSACCASFCSVSAMLPCPVQGTDCTSLWPVGMAPPGYEDVGVCILPQ